jgi:hypothetical protein
MDHEQSDVGAVERWIREVADDELWQRLTRLDRGAPARHRALGVAPHRGRRVERRDREERVARRAVGDHLLDGDDAQVVERVDELTCERPTLHAIDRAAARGDEHVSAALHRAGEHDVLALGDDGRPVVATGRGQRCGDQAPVRCVVRRRSDEQVADEREARLRVDVADDARPLAARRVEQMGVDPPPPDEHLDEHVPAVLGRLHVRPRLLGRQLVEDHGVIGGIGAERVEEDLPVVLIVLGIPRVPEAASVGCPRDRRSAGALDLLAADRRIVDVEELQDAVFCAALAQAQRDQRAVGRGLEPVDRDRGVGRRAGGVEQHPRLDSRVRGGAEHERELVRPLGPLEHEEPVAADLAAEHRRQCGERRQPSLPAVSAGPCVEQSAGVRVLRLHPRCDLGRVAVLEPPVRIGDVDAVEGVDEILTPCRRRTGAGGVSHAPCSGACRGSPWSGAASPSSSWCAST